MVFRSSRGRPEEAGQTTGACPCQTSQGAPQTGRHAQEEKGWEEVMGVMLGLLTHTQQCTWYRSFPSSDYANVLPVPICLKDSLLDCNVPVVLTVHANTLSL